ncbi:MAG: alpha-ribazole phosphatase family protein [Bacteroidales bacterium]|nr:alpha-ribazole phosphatase family protein [Bacteroidales bacterium]
MELFLVRHTSVDVPQGTCYGHSDVPLKDTFAYEAIDVFNQLSHLTFCRVYSSPSLRCRYLAEFCNFSPVIDNKLMEMNFGDWEMQRWDKIKDIRLQKWYENWIETSATNGESFNDIYNRVSLFLDEIRISGLKKTGSSDLQRVLTFTHAGVILCANIYAGIVSFEDVFSSVPDYGSITKIIL